MKSIAYIYETSMGKVVVVRLADGHVLYPGCHKGRVIYRHPKRVPKHIKLRVKELLREIGECE